MNTNAEIEILEGFVSLALELGRMPKAAELKERRGITVKSVEYHFGNFGSLIKKALTKHRMDLDKIFLPEDFSSASWASLMKDISKFNRYVVVSAESGAKVNKNFMLALKNYCKRRNAKLLVMPIGRDLLNLDPTLKGQAIVFHEMELCKNLVLQPIQMSAKSVRPTSGLSRIGARSRSVIYPATKLSKEVVATPGRHAHLILTPGSLTDSQYNEKEFLSDLTKSDYVAHTEHDLAAIVVETNGGFFFTREMQADLDGSIVDICPLGAHRYYPDGSFEKENALALSVGDWHSGETSQDAYDIFPKIARITKAKYVVLHDVHSYSGISHHNEDKAITLARKAEAGDFNIVSEIEGLADDLMMWKKVAKDSKILIAESNHDQHLGQNIENGNLFKDHGNRRTYFELGLAMMNGEDPLKFGLRKYTNLDMSRIEFVGPKNRFILMNKLGQMDISQHGHEAGNGSKGSPGALEKAIGCGITGHTHVPRILSGMTFGGRGNGGLWVNGGSVCVSGEDVAEYARGNTASAWLKTSTLVFGKPNGRFLRTQITIVGGQWCSESGKPQDHDDKLATAQRERKVKQIKKASRGA